MDEDLSEEQMQRIANDLMAGWRPASALSGLDTDQKRWAQKLVGRDNAETLQRLGRAGERFRPKPVAVIYEFWLVDAGVSMRPWRLARIENGRITDQKAFSQDDLRAEIERLHRGGFTVRKFKVDGGSAQPKPAIHRKPFVERYGSFKFEGS